MGLADRFRIEHVSDLDADLAASVADVTNARWSTSTEELLADDRVDVVVICTPPQWHRPHVELACRAQVKAILCEKPLAVGKDDISAVARVVLETQTPLVVGAMHQHDPAWAWARAELAPERHRMTHVRVRIDLPDNAIFEDIASQPVRPRRTAAPARATTPSEAADIAHLMITNLLTHDLPIVRWLADAEDLAVQGAFVRGPYHVRAILRCGDALVDLEGGFHDRRDLTWRLDAESASSALTLEWPPSYIHAGSGRATIRRNGVELTRAAAPGTANGYRHEWMTVHSLGTGASTQSADDVDELIRDATFTERVADAVSRFVREGHTPGGFA
jgi:predicted dehydrogenase